MNYIKSLEYIHSAERFGSRPGLENIRKLMAALGNPQKNFRCLHIAGTNGKGSTAVYAASVLQAAGYKTGLFISPFVLGFRERIQVDRSFISEEELADAVTRVMKSAETMPEIEFTEFELVTAAAFCHFSSQKCDFVCLEVGLGGRLDATNVIENPIVSIICSISKDHTQVLGNTVAEIAAEKCGIIKPCCPVVMYPDQDELAAEVILRDCNDKNAPLTVPCLQALGIFEMTPHGSKFSYCGENFEIKLSGEHQVYNAITAIEALNRCKFSGLDLPVEAVKNGLKTAHFPARMQIIGEKPMTFLDGAHNEDGALRLVNALRRILPEETRFHFVTGMLKDKKYYECIKTFSNIAASIFTVTPANPRALSAEELACVASEFVSETRSFGDLNAAILAAKTEALRSGGVVVICGSLFLAAEVLSDNIKES